MKKIIIFIYFLIFLLSFSEYEENYFKNIKAISPEKETSLIGNSDWYKDVVFYHIWIKAFNDSNKDRIGDIKGVTEKLDYLSDLGIKAIWISPFLDCAFKGEEMHGYDTIDFYNVNKKFGTKEDLKEMLIEAHKRNIRVIFDFVPNLTSELHPWFVNAKAGGDKKSWYVWEKEPEQSWDKPWGGGNMQDVWNKWGDEYYYSAYNGMMPDLNFRNQDAKAVAYVQIESDGKIRKYGVGLDTNIAMASIKSIVSAMNRI